MLGNASTGRSYSASRHPTMNPWPLVLARGSSSPEVANLSILAARDLREVQDLPEGCKAIGPRLEGPRSTDRGWEVGTVVLI